MPKYYKVKKVILADDILKEKYHNYLSEVEIGMVEGPAMTYEKFIDYDLMHEEITMKCLECLSQDKYEHSHFHFMMVMDETPFPLTYCPSCGRKAYMPLDIYRKIKGYRN